MTEKKRPPESADKAGASAAAPMERFKALARQIVNVSNKKVIAERQALSAKKARKSKTK